MSGGSIAAILWPTRTAPYSKMVGMDNNIVVIPKLRTIEQNTKIRLFPISFTIEPAKKLEKRVTANKLNISDLNIRTKTKPQA
jgi:hypothetical protein